MIGERLGALDIHLDDDEWLPGLLHSWIRVAYGREPVWYAEVGVEFRTHSGVEEWTLRQWVPWDAVEPMNE